MFWSDSSDLGFGDDWFRLRRPFGLGNAMEWLPREFVRPGGGREGQVSRAYPALNVWTNSDEAIVTAEVPGVDVAQLDISVLGKSLTINGSRPALELKDGERFLRQERGAGAFSRSIELPFAVDAERVEAEYKLGVLRVTLPRAEKDKPRKISIS